MFLGSQMVYLPLIPAHKKRLPKPFVLAGCRTSTQNIALNPNPLPLPPLSKIYRLVKVAKVKGVPYVDLTVTFDPAEGEEEVPGPAVRFHIRNSAAGGAAAE